MARRNAAVPRHAVQTLGPSCLLQLPLSTKLVGGGRWQLGLAEGKLQLAVCAALAQSRATTRRSFTSRHSLSAVMLRMSHLAQHF